MNELIQEAVLDSIESIDDAQLFAEYEVLISLGATYLKSAMIQEAARAAVEAAKKKQEKNNTVNNENTNTPSGGGDNSGGTVTPAPEPTPTPTPAATPVADASSKAEEYVAKMDLKSKVEQLMVPAVRQWNGSDFTEMNDEVSSILLQDLF